MKRIYVFVCVLYSLCLQAQIQFNAKASRDKIGINERLRVEFTMNKDGDNFIAPDFNGFRKIAGPNQSISQSWVNGKSTFEKKYTYFVQPLKKGKITIGQAEVTIEGQVYKTSPISIEVTEAVENPSLSGDTTPQTKALDGIHLVAEVSKSNPYLNEAIYVVYKLYVSPSTNIRNYRALDNPKYEDFWSQSIDIKKIEVKNGEFGGQAYQYIELRKTILYPQKSGKLKIEPLALSIGVEVPSNRRDIFGRRLYEVVEQTFTSSTKVIDVKPLPVENRPESFTGAVGQFNFDVSVDKTSLLAMESLQASIKVSGEGNMSLFELPDLKTPANTEIFEPEKQDNIRTNAYGMIGSKKNVYTLVPQQAGKQVIPAVEFSFFNPKKEEYVTLKSSNISIDVKPNSAITNSPVPNNMSPNANYIETPNSQFSFIKLNTSFQSSETTYFYKSSKFWIILIALVSLFPLIILFNKLKSNSTQSHGDRALKKANRLAKKYLSEAKSKQGDSNAFYLSLEKALHNYLKAKLRITTSDLSKEKIEELLLSKQADADTTSSFLKLLENCEMARYSPQTQTEIDKDYSTAKNTIAQLDKYL